MGWPVHSVAFDDFWQAAFCSFSVRITDFYRAFFFHWGRRTFYSLFGHPEVDYLFAKNCPMGSGVGTECWYRREK